MASTHFVDFSQNTPIVANWLNDVNANTYTPGNFTKTTAYTAAAWVRFSVSGGVVTIQQSQNITTVTRSSVGIFVVNYNTVLTNAVNCYSITGNLPGFTFANAETTGSVTVNFTNTVNTFTDPGTASVIIFGSN